MLFTGIRAATLRILDSRDVKHEVHDSDAPRRFVIDPIKLKNDPEGQACIDERRNYLPCLCMETAPTYEDKVHFAHALMTDPFTPCPRPCPWNIIWKYCRTNIMPDQQGKYK